MQIDSRGDPHVVKTESAVQTTEALSTEQRPAHYWRGGGRWYAEWIETTGSTHPSRGGLLIDREATDSLHYVYARDDLGWKAWNADPLVQADLPERNVRVSGGAMHVDVASTSTCLDTTERIGVPISTSSNAIITVEMSNDTTATDFRVGWATEEDPVGSVSKEQLFTRALTPISGLRPYSFTITDRDWRGTLRLLEICPVEGAASGRFSIGSIKIRNRQTEEDEFVWNMDSGRTLMVAEADAALNWRYWTVQALLPEVAVGWGDANWSFDQSVYERLNWLVAFPVVDQSGTVSMYNMELWSDSSRYWDWQFDHAEGWTVSEHSGELSIWYDRPLHVLWGRVTGLTPDLLSRDRLRVRIPSGEWSVDVHIRMKNRAASEIRGRVWYMTEAGGEWRQTSFNVTRDSRFHNYTVELTGLSGQTLRRIAFDPGYLGTFGDTFSIDRIWL